MNSLMETVSAVCNNARSKSKSGVSFQELLKLLRRGFKEQELFLKVKSLRHKTLLADEFFVNAYYDSYDDEHGDVPIEIIVHHNFTNGSVWDSKHISEFLVQIFDATVHELKHQRQSKKRKHENYWDHTSHTKSYYNYLADPDEIDAYSLSIAIELCRTLGKFRALKYLSKYPVLSKLRINECYASPNLSAYVGQFQNTNPMLLKRLIKKVYVRLQKVDTDAIFV